ncbi:AraC family transcriptional regulator ligand-binding domain-containing protein [Bradyrhizobium sp. KB893862 SZCCT0404]|uniref:AraC family transcriptional regulator n=1 Tax=Bradyrhizobium sp. KB893862 SZCCT0404 TaxID=2807672 RepID=UPI001BA9CDBE|nr:AraC family transcriptional regulator ligand-binding domain-containing protein [Bradyrhizobium sp. KB893862 SZCCT0404]
MPAARSHQFQSLPSATGGIARLVWARLLEAGIQADNLLAKAGLTRAQIEDRKARLGAESQIRLLELGAEALQDDTLGFHLARDFDLREIGLLYYVAASSGTVAEALSKAERYCHLANEGVSLRFAAKEMKIALRYVDMDRRSDRHQMEFWLTTIIRINRALTNRRLVPSQVRVAHRRRTTPAAVKSFMGCEIEYGCDADEIIFPQSTGLIPIESADHYLNDLLVTYCEEALAHRNSRATSLRSSVEHAIAPLLPHREARVEEIARRLGMSHRTLVRRLALEGLTFSGVLDEMKIDLAKSYLKNDELPISQTAWLLGYGEVSAFTHAFKRWTGMTPRQWRALDVPEPDHDAGDRPARDAVSSEMPIANRRDHP